LPPIGEDIPPLDVAIEEFKAALGKARQSESRLRNILQEGGWLNG
jgi:type I restriction enzyme M protein